MQVLTNKGWHLTWSYAQSELVNKCTPKSPHKSWEHVNMNLVCDWLIANLSVSMDWEK